MASPSFPHAHASSSSSSSSFSSTPPIPLIHYLRNSPTVQTLSTGAVLLATWLYIWHLQPWVKLTRMSPKDALSEKVYNLCHETKSISSEYAKDPSLTPSKISHNLFHQHINPAHELQPPHERPLVSDEELQRGYQCGKFGDTIPSELFLRVWYDALKTLEGDPLVGCCSPSLMGSSGVAPMTVVGSIKDICLHMGNLITRADREVFLATNFWMNSDSSNIITEAIRELSRRQQKRGTKAVVKLMYDRGHLKQIVDNHTLVKPSDYTGKAVNLPHPEEIPGVDLQVMNYHRPMLGTFHCKYMCVDRKIAIISSNNIQSNDNLEMAVHLEGPIADSFWDLCLISWDKELEPPLPCMDSPAADKKGNDAYPTFAEDRFQALFDGSGKLKMSVLDGGETPAKRDGEVKDDEPSYKDGKPHWDIDIAAEIARMQKSLIPRDGERQMDAVARHLNETTHQDTRANAPECAAEDDFCPIFPVAPHASFPIALVNRKPWGAPNHSCVYTPQNEAWLSAIRNAKKEVFIQTPNLNAVELLPELLAAVKRGVEVTYYVCLGYNDSGELLPMQGGTNEMVAHGLYEKLDKEEDKQRLRIFYYVGKDQTKPIHNKFKKRSCHIKLMIVDRHLSIQGNGNQDTQSHFHSQETNIMIDSQLVSEAWLDAIRRNQNTHIYGRAGEDGLWRDENGNQAEGSIGNNPGKFAWAKGIWGAIERVRGAGGF